MTPLKPMRKRQSMLVWQDNKGVERVYEYNKGDAISFGVGFNHATEPHAAGPSIESCSFISEPPAVFLCFNFGTKDCVDDWEDIMGSLPLAGERFTNERRVALGVPRQNCEFCPMVELSDPPRRSEQAFVSQLRSHDQDDWCRDRICITNSSSEL